MEGELKPRRMKNTTLIIGTVNSIVTKDDDMALLIKQIVEKTRQGSPAILHAHKAMVFLDKKDEFVPQN